MKKLLILLVAFAAAFVASATDYSVCVDLKDKDQSFVMRAEAGASDTITFHMLNDGTTITATDYTARLYVDKIESFGSDSAVVVVGTVSGSSATFSVATLTSNLKYARVELRASGAVTGYTYSADGTFVHDTSPLAVSGNPAVIAVMGMNLTGVGVAGTGVTAAEYGDGVFHQTVLTLDDAAVVVVGATGVGFGGLKLYDFAEGHIYVVDVVVDDLTITVGTGLDAADGGDIGLGSVIVADADLGDATDVDFLASTSVDAINTATDASLGAAAYMDGSATAKDLCLNMLIDDADIAATVTNTVDATITVTWLDLGDD